jgi:hypothetical protein
MNAPSTVTSRHHGAETTSDADAGRRALPGLRRRSFALPIGCLLVGLGLLVSVTTLESTIFPTGTIAGTTRRAAALAFCRFILLASGGYLLLNRPRVSAILLSALALGSLLAGLAGAVLLQVAYVPPPVVSGWRSFAPAHEQNQLGFRGRRIAYSPEDKVVILLGDSQVEAMALPFDAMPERRLEFHLNSLGRKTRVVSLGAGGYGQDQELLALQEYFQKYRADLVVLWQTPGNDVWNNVFNTHMANRNPKPTFRLDASGTLRGPSETLGEPLANSRIVLASLWQRAFGLPWRDKNWERHLPEPYVPSDRYAGPVRTEWQERWDTNLGRMRDENLDTEKSHMSVMLAPRSKRMQYGLDLTRALIQRIQELVSANHGRLAILWVDTHDFASDDDQVYVLNGKYYRVSKRQYEANWSYVNGGFDAEVLPVPVKDWRVGPEDGHLNAQATDRVMADLARRLRSRVPAKRSEIQSPR